jgi:hypothetical protein
MGEAKKRPISMHSHHRVQPQLHMAAFMISGPVFDGLNGAQRSFWIRYVFQDHGKGLELPVTPS